MTTERIDIVIREDGSRVVKRNMEDIDSSARRAASGVDFLKRALGGLGVVLLTREILALADSLTNLENRLRSTGLEGTGLTAVYTDLLRVSNETRSSVEGSIELYSRLAISSKELGTSQQQLIDFTKSLNQAIILSGASAQEAQAGLIQLSQGLASGTLRGDELRSILEQLPAVADVIAKGMGVTRGELRKLGEEGKISAQTVLKAFQEARGELDERFAKTIPTLSQSFQVLRNNVLDYVGQLDKSLGVTRALSSLLMTLAQNLDTVTKAVVSLAAGLVLVGGTAALIRGVGAAVHVLTAAIAANPIGAVLVVITSAVTALTLFRDQIMLGADAVTTLGDVFRALRDVAEPTFYAILDGAKALFGPLGTLIADWWRQADFSLSNILTTTAKVVDWFVGLWRGAVRATVALMEGVPPAIADLFTQALNVVLSKLSTFVNKAGELLSTVTEFAGLGKIATNFDFTLDNSSKGAAGELGKNVGDAFAAGMKESTGAQDFMKDIFDRAKQYGDARAEAARLAARNPLRPDATPGKALVKNVVDEKALKQAENALRSLLNTIKPSEGAVLELAKAERTLNEAVKFGLITREQAIGYLALAQRYYEDQINPLKAINREIDEQNAILRVNTDQREVEAALFAITKDLQRQGIDLTVEETNALRAKLQAQQELNRVTQEQDAIFQNSIGARQQFEAQLVALQNMLTNPQFTSGDAATATSDIIARMGLDPAATQVGIDAQLAAFQSMYDKIGQMREKNLIDERTAEQLRAQVAIQATEQRLKNTQDFFSNLATLSSSGNKRIAAIGRAAAMTQATIDGVLAVQKALAAPPGWPYNAGNVIAVGVAAAANVAKIAGFREGGYTGDMGTGQIAGVVHGQEFVANADATRRNRAALEAMNAGATLGAGGSTQNVEVVVNNNANGTQATTSEQDTPDGKRIEITIEEVVVKSVRRGGRIADAMEGQYGLNRAAGTAR